MNKIKEGSFAFKSLQEYVVHLMATLDKNRDEFVDFDEFKSGLEQCKIFLTDHEVHTLVRCFDHNKDGKISMEEFYNSLAQQVAN